jgi:hypothetical protein
LQSSCDLPVGTNGLLDPYQAWLGIPGERQPYTYYQLLGISAAERDEGVIEAAAVRHVSRVRCYQLAYPGEATRLLTEIARALDTLVDPVKRRAYDGQLEADGAGSTTPTRTVSGKPPARKRGNARTERPRGALLPASLALRNGHSAGPARCEVVLRVRPSRRRAPGGKGRSPSR